MATFLHRLCLFGLMVTTGVALSNCQQRMEGQKPAMEDRDDTAAGVSVDAGLRLEPADALDAGRAPDAETGGAMDGGMNR